ncbi:MAG: PorV/PorQ family protein [Elusimicrobia bacterium]|nr:PorV/PorQ family protein [Elusimicrobiota bacterium]MDE2236310.1 PorV/PorQ family protein [Elusimicrobiota bacterium]MDE2424656.1 PorV/PorQ family protein [Elusimicrobiota bacterium]
MRAAGACVGLLVCLLGALPRPAAGFGSGDIGTSGAQFLKLAPSARPAGMAEAFAAVADDVDAVYYNPAGLGTLTTAEMAGSHTALFQDMSLEYAAVAAPLLSWSGSQQPKNAYGTLGFAIYNLSVNNIERRGTTETDSPIGTFGSSDFAYALSYGLQVPGTTLCLGATAKAIDQQLDSAHSSSFAADLGSLYHYRRASLAVGLRNLGTRQQYASAGDPLPLLIYGGGAFRFTKDWLGSLELDLPRDNNLQFAVGTEYDKDFGKLLAGSVRFGYNSKNTGPAGLDGVAFGLGVRYANFEFDFALVPFGELGNAYKYSLLVRF